MSQWSGRSHLGRGLRRILHLEGEASCMGVLLPIDHGPLAMCDLGGHSGPSTAPGKARAEPGCSATDLAGPLSPFPNPWQALSIDQNAFSPEVQAAR